ncbi:hypothetical protein BSZ21_38960 [Bradyrhizobium canariense]|uniref:hypothetical protein n=1 Tax=Bradyrhizobium canariense TaxID=255045 RepID=UPI000A194D76|nr:hypothetical protein [Bradyrhizobium canariense]OSI60343.1 hypothetical protein BSZ21_38960 [Bradyrhizobium canariense]
MGEAKRRRLQSSTSGGIVYHHTSTLRTNLLWMSGVVEVEGQGHEPIHPHIGVIKADVLRRRAMQDFPPLAWFTADVAVPKCLRNMKLCFTDKTTGEVRYEDQVIGNLSDAIALNRVALGFRLSDCPVIVKWSEHPGYGTAEGRELNESALDCGDDPNKWYVSEQAIDLLKVVEFWSSRKIVNPKMQREDWYVKDLHNMVHHCRERKDLYIPPTWLKSHEAKAMAAAMGVPAIDGDQQVPAHLTRTRAGE